MMATLRAGLWCAFLGTLVGIGSGAEQLRYELAGVHTGCQYHRHSLTCNATAPADVLIFKNIYLNKHSCKMQIIYRVIKVRIYVYRNIYIYNVFKD